MRLDALLPDMPLDAAHGAKDITALVYDSRRIVPGCLFATWQGAKRDGHGFIAGAIAAGAAAILCERAVPDAPDAVAVVVAPDVRGTLAQMARLFYGNPSEALSIVGITGTNGKTSCAYLIEGMLRAAGKKPGVIGTLGARFDEAAPSPNGLATTLEQASGLTTPESTDLCAALSAMHQAGARSVVMEASSQALHQKRLAGVAFDVAVFTNLTHDHLDYHGDLEAYFQAKAELVRTHLKPRGKAVLNDDDVRVRGLGNALALRFSATWPKGRAMAGAAQDASEGKNRSAAPGIYVRRAALGRWGTKLQVHTPRGVLPIESPLLGALNTANILAAIAVGEALGLEHDDMARGIGQVACVPGRLQPVSIADEPLVVVDYAHTPDALRQALSAMRALGDGQLFCVFGCGGDRDVHKRAMMGQAAYYGADWSIVTNDNPRYEDSGAIAAAITGGMLAAGGHLSETPSAGGFCTVLDRGAAISRAVSLARARDVVLIAGKGHETYQIIGGTKHAFDDRSVARRALDVHAARQKALETAS